MDCFDVVIVGAGPGGLSAARQLSNAGFKVLLLEKERSFAANDFSSGGAPLEILSDFQLPEHVVGAYCCKIRISATQDSHVWQDDQPVAVVLDFKKLRTFLAEEAIQNGASLFFGCAYRSYRRENSALVVNFKKAGDDVLLSVRAKVLIDATGSDRRVLGEGLKTHGSSARDVIVGRGIEYLVEVPEAVYQTYANCLSFFIGSKWMPQGYAWIFPMSANLLKIGVGRNFPNTQFVPHHRAMKDYLDQLIIACLKTEEIKIIDRHGKTISYTCHHKDPYVDQNIIAIGDAVSTVNPLTFEGIRHALKSGEIAARQVQGFLEKKIPDLKPYACEMRRYCGMRWLVSELLTQKIYREPEDEKMTLMLHALKALSLSDLKDLVFYYRFKIAMKFYAKYQILLLKRVFSFSP
ncbi:hypothetical protein MNBD_NITROSPIRAE01-1069 [hydrothermal vent metagenome]|uniref:Digeranylgeranylglycerophospholipid reductase catalytic domain-containing protein n=1 Tax=hydrothermal vent metagenome TaxID=652676 RepID=A0A3B1CR19_9ZZZZ